MHGQKGKLNLGVVDSTTFFNSLLDTIKLDPQAENSIVAKLSEVVEAVRANSVTDVKVTIGVTLNEAAKSIEYDVRVVGK